MVGWHMQGPTQNFKKQGIHPPWVESTQRQMYCTFGGRVRCSAHIFRQAGRDKNLFFLAEKIPQLKGANSQLSLVASNLAR